MSIRQTVCYHQIMQQPSASLSRRSRARERERVLAARRRFQVNLSNSMTPAYYFALCAKILLVALKRTFAYPLGSSYSNLEPPCPIGMHFLVAEVALSTRYAWRLFRGQCPTWCKLGGVLKSKSSENAKPGQSASCSRRLTGKAGVNNHSVIFG